MSVKTCSLIAWVASVAVCRPTGVRAARVTRPSAGSDAPGDQAVRLEAVDGVGDAGRVDLQAFTDLAERERISSREGEQHQDLVAGERESERPQDGVGPGQEDLLESHDGRDDRHRTRLVGPPVGLPLPFRLGDGIEAQPSGFGHSGTLDRRDPWATRPARGPPARATASGSGPLRPPIGARHPHCKALQTSVCSGAMGTPWRRFEHSAVSNARSRWCPRWRDAPPRTTGNGRGET